MKIDYMFPHPFAEVQLDIDNKKLLDTVEESIRDFSKTPWDCEVYSTYTHRELNNSIMSSNIELIEQVQHHGREFLKEVGWQSDASSYAGDFWFNLYENHHWQESHHHGIHEICAIYYATNDIVATEFLNPNDYTFHTKYPRTGSSPVTSRYHSAYPKPGKLILFPGYIMHQVPYKTRQPITYEQKRLTVAFNFDKETDRIAEICQKKT
jgi:uncharacterized protein (TIGR02466 family)